MRPLNIAVTGASGFLGRHVVDAVVNRGLAVTAIARDPWKMEWLSDRAQIVRGDITQPNAQLTQAIVACDAMIHLAWDGLPNYMSCRHFEVELRRQYDFFKTLAEAGLKHVFVSGTCFEYGLQNGALTEDLPTHPVTAYGLAKDTLRRQLELLARDFEISVTWGRLFYTYGDGQAANSLYSQLKAAIANGDPVFPMSGGEQLRDYLPVEELADLIVRVATAHEKSGVLNICSGVPISIRSLVERLVAKFDRKIELKLGVYPYSPMEPMAFWGDRCKLDKVLFSDADRAITREHRSFLSSEAL